MNSQKIQEIEIRNIKGVKQIKIVPNPTIVKPAGKNGAGKSTVLDCIRWAFGGKKAIKDAKPIRHGEDKAEIVDGEIQDTKEQE